MDKSCSLTPADRETRGRVWHKIRWEGRGKSGWWSRGNTETWQLWKEFWEEERWVVWVLELIYSLSVGMQTSCKSQSTVSSEHLDRFWTCILTLFLFSSHSFLPFSLSLLRVSCSGDSSMLLESVVLEDFPVGTVSGLSQVSGELLLGSVPVWRWHSAQPYELAVKYECTFLHPLFGTVENRWWQGILGALHVHIIFGFYSV